MCIYSVHFYIFYSLPLVMISLFPFKYLSFFMFQKEAIPWAWEYLTSVCGLDKDRFYITYFGGTDKLPADEEAKQIWLDLGSVVKHKFFSADYSVDRISRIELLKNDK